MHPGPPRSLPSSLRPLSQYLLGTPFNPDPKTRFLSFLFLSTPRCRDSLQFRRLQSTPRPVSVHTSLSLRLTPVLGASKHPKAGPRDPTRSLSSRPSPTPQDCVTMVVQDFVVHHWGVGPGVGRNDRTGHDSILYPKGKDWGRTRECFFDHWFRIRSSRERK